MEGIMLLLTDTACMLSKKNIVSGSLILKEDVIQCWKKFCLILLGGEQSILENKCTVLKAGETGPSSPQIAFQFNRNFEGYIKTIWPLEDLTLH